MVAAMALPGCRSDPARDVARVTRPAPTKILLITIDTTRADHLSAYGYERATTPWLDAFAGAGVRFESAYCAMPTTDPSHATMLTGQHPRSHGIMRNAALRRDPTAPTLATWLVERGYATAAITARLGLHPARRGLAGFDHADAPELPKKWRDAGEIVALVREWLAQRTASAQAADRPERWFLWAHLWEPHKPYEPEPSDLDRIAPAVDVDIDRADDPPRFLRSGERVGRSVVDAAVARYDAEILGAEAAAREIVELAAASEPVGEPPLVLIVSDHGESLGERQATRRVAFGHGALVYDEVVKVPWIVSWPGVVEPAVVRAPVSLVDMSATVMDLVEPGGGFATEGRSLARSILEGTEPDTVPIYVERRRFSSDPVGYLHDAEAALLEHPWKLILNEGRLSPELFRLDEDPGERRDRAADEPARVHAMRERLEAWKRARPLSEPAAAPSRRRAAELDALRSLGYVD